MEPAAAALAGEPRKPGAAPVPAPGAAHWLTHPTPHDATPDPGSPAAARALLVALGSALDDDAGTPENQALLSALDTLFSPADLERRKQLEPCTPNSNRSKS
jgi:hypothetical protein